MVPCLGAFRAHRRVAYVVVRGHWSRLIRYHLRVLVCPGLLRTDLTTELVLIYYTLVVHAFTNRLRIADCVRI